MKKYLSILFALVLVVSFSLVPAVVSADGTPTIDGVISDGEWNDYYLGTSVTTWSGGMSVDVYGFMDDTYLYAAYVADTTQPGWAMTCSMCIECNFYYKTPQSASWPDQGNTILGFGGDGIGQTDGSGWDFDSFGGWGIQTDEWTNEGIEYYVGEPCYGSPYPNTAEIKIPLSLLTYAGADDQIRLSGQYWQYDWADPFYVSLAAPPITTATLFAGQTIDVGTVSVWNDATSLYVTYQTTGDWVMTETHLHVAEDVGAIPQTEAKGKSTGGNPIPGHFDYGGYYDPPETEVTFTIPLDGWDAGTLYIAAHAVVVLPCWETVWQIGDVEVVNAATGWLENYADEFNWGTPAGPTAMGPSLAVEQPAYTDPFVEETTLIDEFPFNSNFDKSYATDFDVQWYGELPFGGKLTISWSPGASGDETKVVSGDGITPTTFNATGASKPGEGWFMDTYPLVQHSVQVGPLPDGTHSINFKHTKGNGTYWDWIRLEKPCEQEETAWAGTEVGQLPFDGKNWATYFEYTVSE